MRDKNLGLSLILFVSFAKFYSNYLFIAALLHYSFVSKLLSLIMRQILVFLILILFAGKNKQLVAVLIQKMLLSRTLNPVRV